MTTGRWTVYLRLMPGFIVTERLPDELEQETVLDRVRELAAGRCRACLAGPDGVLWWCEPDGTVRREENGERPWMKIGRRKVEIPARFIATKLCGEAVTGRPRAARGELGNLIWELALALSELSTHEPKEVPALFRRIALLGGFEVARLIPHKDEPVPWREIGGKGAMHPATVGEVDRAEVALAEFLSERASRSLVRKALKELAEELDMTVTVRRAKEQWN